MPRASVLSGPVRVASPLRRWGHACTWLLLLLLPLLLWMAPAGAAPRDTVERVATLIENNYFDPAAGHRIATMLRAAAATGRYDSLTDPRDLATALTEQLHPLNHHFRVSWSPGAGMHSNSEAPALAGPSAQRPNAAAAGGPAVTGASLSRNVPIDAFERRTGYGFQRVQILPGDVGYLQLQSFADIDVYRHDDPARAAADAALQLLSGADAIIIDLRDDIGGSLDMSAYLISAFVPPAADVYDVIHWRGGTESERPKHPYAGLPLQQPLFLLTSARTASAAEAFAYALQAYGRATIIGDVTAGAADPGGAFPAGGGFAIFVSLGTPINPLTGGNWEGTGVKPDVRVPASLALQQAQQRALTRELAADPRGPDAADMRLVLEALRAEERPAPGPPLRQYAGTYQDVVVSVQGDRLSLRQGRRIPLSLSRLQGDTFFDRGEPSRRIIFVRRRDGAIRGFEFIYSNGHLLWFPGSPCPNCRI